MVKLARLENIPESENRPRQQARRREHRYETWFDAKLETTHGDGVDVRVSEVSLHGCRIKGDVSCIRTGTFVAISAEGGRKLRAIIRWVREDTAGMEFLRPVPAECTEWHDLMDAPF